MTAPQHQSADTIIAVKGRGVTSRLAIRRDGVMIVGILAAVIWVTQFSQSPHFGLYEDDWDFIGQSMVWTSGRLLEWIVISLRYWPQGRPIGFAAVPAIAFVGNWIGGLEAVYIISFFLHTVNASLVFAIARRYVSLGPALCAALGFSLFPADTSVPLLTNGLFLGLTGLFLLSALLLYLKGSRVLAYCCAGCCLLIYESAFLPFFAAPILTRGRVSELSRQLLKQAAILLAIAGSVFWFRTHIGEERSATLVAGGLLDNVQRVATALWVGPVTSLRLSVVRPGAIFQLGMLDGLPIVLVFIGLTAALYLFKVETSDALESWPLSLKAGRFRLQMTLRVDHSTAAALRFGISGAVMFVIAYGLAISRDHYPPINDSGRLTGGTHMAAAVGYGFVLGALASILLDLAVTHRKKIIAVLLLSLYFSGLAAFHSLVQRDFVSSWRIQQAFWRSVVEECPDLTDGTVLIFEDLSYPLRYVQTNSWADPYVLTELFKFPSYWKQPPQLFPVASDWRSQVIQMDGQLILPKPLEVWPTRVLKDREVILLKADGSGVRRITGTTTVKSQQLELKPLGNPMAYPPNGLYPYVIQGRVGVNRGIAR